MSKPITKFEIPFHTPTGLASCVFDVTDYGFASTGEFRASPDYLHILDQELNRAKAELGLEPRRARRMPAGQQLIKFKRLPHGEGLPLPAKATPGAAGFDLCAAWEDGRIGPGDTAIVPTGFSIEVPPGYEAQVRPRSGLAAQHSVTVLNSPGTIDCDYRGEVKVILINHSDQRPFLFKKGDRIAQLVIAPIIDAEALEFDELSGTERGEGGFGSTGR